MKTQTLSINGIKHRVFTWGSSKKPKLFLFHGWMDTGASFDFMCRKLAPHFYCIAPDLRGFGGTAHTTNPLGYFFFEYVADAHALFEHFSPDSPVAMLGHSMGGNILSYYAGTYPERVRAFINLEGFGIRHASYDDGPQRMRAWIESLDRSKDPRFKPYPTFKAMAERLNASNPRLDPKKARFLAKHMGKKTSRGIQFRADPKHKWPHPHLFRLDMMIPFWKAIRAKTLLVAGENSNMKDWMGGKDLKEEIKRRLSYFPKHSRSIMLQKCGHMMHHEAPEKIADIVRDFLT